MGVLHGNRDRVEPPGPNLAKSRDPLADPIGKPRPQCDVIIDTQLTTSKHDDIPDDAHDEAHFEIWIRTPSPYVEKHSNAKAHQRNTTDKHTTQEDSSVMNVTNLMLGRMISPDT